VVTTRHPRDEEAQADSDDQQHSQSPALRAHKWMLPMPTRANAAEGPRGAIVWNHKVWDRGALVEPPWPLGQLHGMCPFPSPRE
jgi:hypothetical protein